MDGIIVVNKPQGMTSHDVVDFIRKRFGIKKAGHAGTLDPMATGVLVILVGKYTKLSGRFMSEGKEYRGSLVLGVTSDTLDIWGKVAPSGTEADFSDGRIRAAFAAFTGKISQKPPMFSSVKVRGRRLYEMARKGLKVDAPAREVTIDDIEVLKIELPCVSFRMSCSKGTYVRSVCAEIGDILGCGACMSALERTRSGSFGIDMAVTVDELRSMDADALKKIIRTV